MEKKEHRNLLNSGLIRILVAGLLLQGLGNDNAVRSQNMIRINQLGYRPEDPKVALIGGGFTGTFEVRDIQTDEAVFRGEIKSLGRRDAATGDDTFELDFTPLRKNGTYRIWLPGTTVVSSEFNISPSVYRPAYLAALQSFHYQRCGTAVDNGTPWKHPACHTDDAPFFEMTSTRKDVAGGWHDAGDYNKFVPSTAVCLAFLLYLYELRPDICIDSQVVIPESGNAIPDLLDEARWGLEWLLKMQREDGGVYHKVSIKKWSGEHLPQEEKDVRHIFEVSSTATASTAAVCALGARHFQRWDREFARRLLKAAVSAWQYLNEHKTIVPPGGFKNPAGVKGGEYGDDQDADERLWAAVELYRLTGSHEVHNYLFSHIGQMSTPNIPISWQNVKNFALFASLHIPSSWGDNNVRQRVMAHIAEYADRLTQRVGESGYHCVLSPNEFYWGSNSVALAYAFELIQCYELLGRRRYRDAALDQLHYILGRNPFDLSFVTGVGARSVSRPYHQFSMLANAGRPVPGMVVGGPNKGSRLQGKLLSDYPGKCYEDNEKNYFVNETAINYTAPLVFVAGYFGERKSDTSMKSTYQRSEMERR